MRVGRARKTRADLEQQLKACRRQIARARERLAEAIKQQTATSEMLRLISNSPIQSVLDGVAEHAARLCDASNARIWRLEGNLIRLVASHGESSATLDGREGLPVNRDTATGRAACDRRTIHVHDISAEDSEFPLGSSLVKDEGWRTTLATPLLREGTPIGTILVRRMEVRPFSDRQIALLETFAGQAAIAIENVRLLEAEKQRTLALAQSEYMLRQIVETVPGFVWSTGPDGEPSRINQRVLDYSGMQFEEFLQFGWKQFLHPDDFPETAKAFHHAIRTGTPYDVVHRLRRADGEYRWYHARGEPLRDREGRIVQWYGLSTDVDESKRAEERLRVQHTVALILAEAATIEEATPRILLAIGECLGWDVGVLWRIDREAKVLRCVELWHTASIKVPEFERASRESTFGPGVGLPGRVWSGLAPEYIPDVVPDENFPRAPIAEREGLRAAFGFPILLGGEVLGAIEFFSREIRQPDRALLDVLATIGSQIGQFIERRRAEQALREREARIRRLVDANIIGIFIWDFDGRILEANDAFLHIVGYDHEDLVAGRLRWTELTPPEWRDRDAELMQEHMVAGTLQPFEKEYFRKDGSRVPVLIGVATFEEGGDQGVAFVLDLTERKRAEQALRESERSLRAAIDGIAGLVAIFAPNGELEALNRQVIDYFGRSFEEMKSWGTSDAVHPGDLPRIADIFQGSITAGTPFHYELRLRRFDGEYRWFDNRCVPIREENGRIARWYMLGTDVEDRKRAEEGLRESEAKFRDYAETASDWFWEIGPDFKFTLLTENAFGSGAADRIGTACWDHALDRETEPEKWSRVRAALDSREPFRDLVYCARGGDGSPMYVKASGKPVIDANGEFRGYRGTGADVTGIIRAQEEHERLRELESHLSHMNRVSLMGELAASLVHEITQPIAAARNNARAAAHFLDRNPPDLGEIREALSCLVADADRAGKIIDGVRGQIKKVPPGKDRFDLNEAIKDVIELVRIAIGKNGVAVHTRLTKGTLMVEGDRVQLQQVALNLILNAIEAMSSVATGPRDLSIGTEQSGPDEVRVAVRDSGPGIDPKDLERVFQTFYTTKSGGTGMGLSISRSIVAAHGGRLWAELSSPRGAIFQFTLPAGRDQGVRSASR